MKEKRINKLKQLKTAIDQAYLEIMTKRNDIIRAFIAETGTPPSEIEMIVQPTPKGIRWYLQKRKK